MDHEPVLISTIAIGLMARLARLRAGGLDRLDDEAREALRGHAIIAGYGRVGRMIGGALRRRGFDYVVVTQLRDEVDRLRTSGVAAIYGDASIGEVLDQAHVERARLLIATTGDASATLLIVERARGLNPGMDIVARTHSDAEAARLRGLSSRVQAVHGERELAVQMTRYSLRRFGVSAAEAESIAQGLRGRGAIARTPPLRPSPVERIRERLGRLGGSLRKRTGASPEPADPPASEAPLVDG